MSEQNQVEDLYSLSLEELKKRADAEARGEQQPTEAEKKEQPRDEQGRFTKPEEQAEAEDEQQQEEEPSPKRQLFRRVVDIGNGVDPEIFEAESLEELVDKIADAKAHATKKIREQESQLRKQRETERQFTDDEEYVYSQELMTKPTKAFAKMFKDMVGMDITEFKDVAERSRAMQTAQQRNAVIEHFLNTHPDYVDNQRNTDVMTLAMQGHQLSAESLEKAYLDMKAKGLLEFKSGKQGSEQEEAEQPKPGITEQAVTKNPSQGTKKASSLSTKNRNPVPVKSNEPSEDELYSMPLDKLRELGNKHLANR